MPGLLIAANLIGVEALRALVRNRMRTGLTTLGIAIGIAAVVWVVAVGQAGSERAQAQLQNLGENLIWVEAGSRTVSGVRLGSHGTNTLTLEDNQDDDFNIRRPDEIIKAQIEAAENLALLLLCLAGVSLVVGGVGILNVMLASVAERTREIGLRLAVGATQGAVQVQFLGEAVMISLLGGLFGVALSIAGSYLLGRSLGWPVAIPPDALALGVEFSPARKASRLDPIDALRHE